MDAKYSFRSLIPRDAILPLDSDLYDESAAAEPPDRMVAGSTLAPVAQEASEEREASEQLVHVGHQALVIAGPHLDEAQRHADEGSRAADMAQWAGRVHEKLNGAYKFLAPFVGLAAGATVGTFAGQSVAPEYSEPGAVGCGVGIVAGVLLGVAAQVGPSRVASYLQHRYDAQSAQSDRLALECLAEAQPHVEAAVHAGVAPSGHALERLQQIRSQLPAGPDLPPDVVEVVVAADEPADGLPAPLEAAPGPGAPGVAQIPLHAVLAAVAAEQGAV